MKKSRYAWQSAALLLFTLGARTAMADQGIAYAWINNGTTAFVSPEYSFNPAGGAVTASHNGTGSYTVTFPNSGIGTGWSVQATAYGSTPNYCNVTFWGGSATNVQCYNPAGSAADTEFTVLAVSNNNDKFIFFAWADQPTAKSYTPNTSYSYNNSGGVTITRSSTGTYDVTFSGLGGSGGTVQIDAYGSNATCYSGGWTGSSSISAAVDCLDPTGKPVDSYFVIDIVPASQSAFPDNPITPAGLAFSWADQPSTTTYAPNSIFTYSPTGSDVNITRQSAGQYLVKFAGLNIAQVLGGNARATAYGSQARCNVQGWTPDGTNLLVAVDCYNFAGAPTDSEYEVLLLAPASYAYAWIYDGSTASVSSAYSVNPSGMPVTASHDYTGAYGVHFPNSGCCIGWTVQAIAYGGGTDFCDVEGWDSAGNVDLFCFDTTGALADSEFTVLAISNTSDKNIAFAWPNQPGTGSYSPDPTQAYNPGGSINVTRSGTGNYSVVFNGLNGGGGTVQVASATITLQFYAYCSTGGWSGPSFTVSVVCTDANGANIDAAFTVAVIPAGAAPTGIGYAWANLDTEASYTPDPTYSYNSSGGAISATRFGVGDYQMTFAGLAAGLVGGDVRVTTYDNLARCKVASWSSGGADLVASVNCYDTKGSPADSSYTILVFAPVPGGPASGAPGAVTVNGGSPQSTLVNTAFPAALSAMVTDGVGNPFVGATVTFTAPASGPSGTFPGSTLTARANTNASGVATAPIFTANGTAGGPYVVTASVLGVATPANFSLTNNPLIAITLQTSPAGLLVSVDGGSFTAAPLVVSWAPGSLHTIATETPQAGVAGTQFVFSSWSDGGALSHTFSTPGVPLTFTASFQTQYQLTTSANPGAGGSVTPPSGTFYDASTVVPISATANAGFTFTGWSGSVASAPSASTTVTMSAPETVTANFAPPTGITIQTVPPGLQISVDGGPPQTAPQTVSLTLGSHTIAVTTPQAGTPGTQYAFAGWSDGGAASHSIVVTSSAATYTATFTAQYLLTTSVSPAGAGTVTASPSGSYYNTGTIVQLTASPVSGYVFSNWSGDLSGSANPQSITMGAPHSVIANFSPPTGITIQTAPPGLQISVDGGPPQTAPQTVSLTLGSHTIAVATPQAGTPGTQYAFAGWSDGGAASHSIVVTSSAATYTATFTAQYLLTTSVSPASAGTVTASPSGSYYNTGTIVQLTASPGSGYLFSNWSGDLSGSTNPQSITMGAPHSVTANFSAGTSPCTFTLGPASATTPPTGTSTVETCPNNSGQPNCGVTPESLESFTVTPNSFCGTWTATSSNPGVLQIKSGGSGTGAGAVGFSLLNNTHTSAQTYTVTVASGGASATYTVTEAGSGDTQVYREVYALYEQLLGRDPDPAGFAFWTGSGGAGLGQMADSFLTSPEAFNNDFVVMAVYQAATGAPPTFAQYNAAVVSIRAGTQTVMGLFNSLINGSYTATTLYQNLLNRAPSAAEIADANQAGLAQWFQILIGYPSNTTPVSTPNNEFQSTGIYDTTLAADHTNGLYVRMLYYVILSRDPDPAGLTFWTGVANSGGPGLLFQGNAGFGTRIQILGPGTPNQGFIGSPEFQGLFAN